MSLVSAQLEVEILSVASGPHLGFVSGPWKPLDSVMLSARLLMLSLPSAAQPPSVTNGCAAPEGAGRRCTEFGSVPGVRPQACLLIV